MAMSPVPLEKAAVVRVIQHKPEFSQVFIANLLGRNIRVKVDLVDQLFNSSEKRLARLLLLLANFGQEEEPEPIIAKISQETLVDGGIEVHRSLLTVVLHETPEIKT